MCVRVLAGYISMLRCCLGAGSSGAMCVPHKCEGPIETWRTSCTTVLPFTGTFVQPNGACVCSNKSSILLSFQEGDYGNGREGWGWVQSGSVPSAGAHIFAGSMKYTHRPVREGHPEGEIIPAGLEKQMGV